MGVSMGGYGSWVLGSMAPDVFAAVVPICAFGPPTLSGVYVKQHLPLYFAHGVNDEVVPVTASDEIVAALKKAGHERVKYDRYPQAMDPEGYPGTGHAAWRNLFADKGFWEWLGQQHKR